MTQRLLIALLALVVLGGCGDDDEQSAQAPAASLEGTPWVLTGGIDVPGWETVAPSASFAGGTMSGSNGCNRYGAKFTADGSSLTLGEVSSTSMACPEPPARDVERAFDAALGRVVGWRVAGGELTLLDGDDRELLRFRAASPIGSWEVTSFLQASGVSSPLEGSKLTAEFAEGGTLRGSAGCNDYSGTYILDSGVLTITELSATEMACGSPAGVMEQEQAFLAALPKTAGYTVDGTSLTLLTREGTIVATLAAP